MKIECVNSEIVITSPLGFVDTYNRSHYEEFINRERKMLATVQSNIDEAERMIELIDGGIDALIANCS